MKPVILGNGVLGTELAKQTGWDVLSRSVNGIELTDSSTWESKLLPYDTIINCIAFTDTYSIDRQSNWDTNYKAVITLTDYCNNYNKKIVHISTDYIYANSNSNASETDVPVHANNWYSYTKLLGDAYVQAKAKDYLVIRESHKPSPFPYLEAWKDVRTNGDLVDKISDLIIKLITGKGSGVFNVGTAAKTIYEMAFESKTTPVSAPSYVPRDTTMKLEKLNNFLK